MIVQWIARCSETLITGVVLSLALVTSGYSQSVPDSEEATEPEEEIEEIRVYGHKSLLIDEFLNKKQLYENERKRRCEGRLIHCRK